MISLIIAVVISLIIAVKGCGDQFNNCFKVVVVVGLAVSFQTGVISLITALKLWVWRWSSGLSIQTGDQEVPGSNPR